MQFDRNKLKSVILYACSNSEPQKLGAVKLHKILYFSDMLRYAHKGSPLTGSTYKKRPFGPTNESLLECVKQLEKEGNLKVLESEYFGYAKKEFHVVSDDDSTRLNDEEKKLLNDVIDFVCNQNSAKTISEFSHNLAWDSVNFSDVIPYVSVFSIFPTSVSEEDLDWADNEVALIEDARTERETRLGGRNIRDFRSSLSRANPSL